MAQILEKSADPGKQRPKWYDNFIYATIEGLSSKNNRHEVEKAAALALSNGGHFIEKANAEQILDSVLLSDHRQLILVLIKQSLGTRPNELDFQQLFDLKKAETLAIIYKEDKAAFERDLPKILNFINEDFGLQLLIRVCEQNNDISNDIMENVLKACLNSTSNNSRKCEFLIQLSPKLNSNFGPTIISDVLEKSEDQKVIEALVCYCNPDLMNRYDEILKLFSCFLLVYPCKNSYFIH